MSWVRASRVPGPSPRTHTVHPGQRRCQRRILLATRLAGLSGSDHCGSRQPGGFSVVLPRMAPTCEELAVPEAQEVGVVEVAVLIERRVRGGVDQPAPRGLGPAARLRAHVVEVRVAAIDDRPAPRRAARSRWRGGPPRPSRHPRGGRGPRRRSRARSARGADRSRGHRPPRRSQRSSRSGRRSRRARRRTSRAASSPSLVNPAVSPDAIRSANVIRSGCETMPATSPESIAMSRPARYAASRFTINALVLHVDHRRGGRGGLGR